MLRVTLGVTAPRKTHQVPLSAAWRDILAAVEDVKCGARSKARHYLANPGKRYDNYASNREQIMSTVANALSTVVRMADKLAHDIPRSLDVATLRYAVHQLAAALAKPPTAPIPTRKQSRSRQPGYWAERKRVQRARGKTGTQSLRSW
jgi:hypothetical protein